MFSETQVVDSNCVVLDSPVVDFNNFKIQESGFSLDLRNSDIRLNMHVQNYTHAIHSHCLGDTISCGFTMFELDKPYRTSTAFLNIEQARELISELQSSVDEHDKEKDDWGVHEK